MRTHLNLRNTATVVSKVAIKAPPLLLQRRGDDDLGNGLELTLLPVVAKLFGHHLPTKCVGNHSKKKLPIQFSLCSEALEALKFGGHDVRKCKVIVFGVTIITGVMQRGTPGNRTIPLTFK